jgi:hypothetical protein
MEIHDANIEQINSEYYLSLKINGDDLKIPLTKDEPNEIKVVFNKLVLHLKKGPFKFTMKEKDDDLICQVANEYIKQLNSELSEIYEELEANQLLNEK